MRNTDLQSHEKKENTDWCIKKFIEERWDLIYLMKSKKSHPKMVN